MNPLVGRFTVRASAADVRAFHATLSDDGPTPLVRARALAEELGLGEVWVKHERGRAGVPAFKILGASWATRCALDRDVAGPASASLDELRARAAAGPVARLVAATDGNHGHAVATVAALLGLQARIYVPAGTTAARLETIADAGAALVEVAGSYDDAVLAAAVEASPEALVVTDTPSVRGGEDTARWVIDGYGTILAEVEEQLGGERVDVVMVPCGTGGLAAAVVRHFAGVERARRPRIVVVEPDGAACAYASMQAGRIVTIAAGPADSIMAGLNCGTPSSVAFASLASGVDAFVTIGDDRAVAAMRAYRRAGIATGETGAAALGGLIELAEARALGLGPDARVLVLCTEGVTDPEAYARLLAA